MEATELPIPPYQTPHPLLLLTLAQRLPLKRYGYDWQDGLGRSLPPEAIGEGRLPVGSPPPQRQRQEGRPHRHWEGEAIRHSLREIVVMVMVTMRRW